MKKALFAFLVFATAFSVSAKSFSLQLIQENTGGEEIFDASYVVEQTILDYFFERGMIVSNNTLIVSDGDNDNLNRQLKLSLLEAREGGMDLLVKLHLVYTGKDNLNPSFILLANIKSAQLEIVSTSAAELVAKGSFAPKKITANNNNRRGVENFATDIAKEIQARLASKGGAQ